MDDEDRQSYERKLAMLSMEMDHRVKNTLAIVLAIARRAADGSEDLPTFMRKFEARVQSLKRTHELLGLTHFEGVDLKTLFLSEIHPFRFFCRISVEGPGVFLPARTALTVATCVHEMTTNAVKYGVLSEAGGALTISWQVTPADLVIDWVERDGPPILTPPTRVGLGSRLIKLGLQLDLKGSFTLDFPREGVAGQVRIPVAALRP